MDIDKPLDDLIPKKTRGTRAERPRVSRDRRDAAPYAVRPFPLLWLAVVPTPAQRRC